MILEERERLYYANVHRPSRFRAYANTGCGVGSYWLGESAMTLARLERKFIKLARQESVRKRQATARVEFTVWPPKNDPPYRVVEIVLGKVVRDERTEPEWSLS